MMEGVAYINLAPGIYQRKQQRFKGLLRILDAAHSRLLLALGALVLNLTATRCQLVDRR